VQLRAALSVPISVMVTMLLLVKVVLFRVRPISEIGKEKRKTLSTIYC